MYVLSIKVTIWKSLETERMYLVYIYIYIYVYIYKDLVVRTEFKYCFKKWVHGIKNVLKL